MRDILFHLILLFVLKIKQNFALFCEERNSFFLNKCIDVLEIPLYIYVSVFTHLSLFIIGGFLYVNPFTMCYTFIRIKIQPLLQISYTRCSSRHYK